MLLHWPRKPIMTIKKKQTQSVRSELRNRITAPTASQFEITRQVVSAVIESTKSKRLILVHGPAGFGKTTVLSQVRRHLESEGIATAWLTLNESDNDLPRFLISLNTSLDQVAPSDYAPLLESDDIQRSSLQIMDRIHSFDIPAVAFFDECEVLHNPAVLSLIATRIEMLPPGSCLVVGSRNNPDFALSRLRARGYMSEFDVNVLRFSTDETNEYFAGRGLPALTAEHIQQLQRNTEGWPAAIWLASIALETHTDPLQFLSAFSGSDKAISDYLAEEVLSTLTPDVRKFLIETSILNELAPDVCNAVCSIKNSEILLTELRLQGLFLQATDQNRPEFRYQRLFRDFLRTQLHRKKIAQVRQLHRRASEFYVNSAKPIRAIRHALEANDEKHALALLKTHAESILKSGRTRLLANFLGKLSSEILAPQPLLQLIHAWCVTFTHGPLHAMELVANLELTKLPPQAAAYLRALRAMLLAMTDHIDEAHSTAMELLDATPEEFPFARAMLFQTLSQTSIILGDHDSAQQYFDETRRIQRDGTGTLGFMLSESAETVLDLLRGRLRQALTRIRLANQRFADERDADQPGNPLAAIEFAEALYETGKLEDAQTLLLTYAPQVRELGPPDALISSHVLLASIAEANQDWDRSLLILNELENCGHELALERVVASARLARANLHLKRNSLIDAQQQIHAAERSADWATIESHWYIGNNVLLPSIVRSRWLINSGKYKQAAEGLKPLLDIAEREGRKRRAFTLRLLFAQSLYADGQVRLAQRALAPLLDYALQEGYVQAFADEGGGVQAMLRDLSPELLETLHETSGTIANSQKISNAANLSDPLTPKELQVLQLLAQGMRNAEMGESMFVSESTVRTHLRNINLKLEAKNRTQAIVIARRLGLVS
jgi:LuxR family maltose regulon positive regulatory protein